MRSPIPKKHARIEIIPLIDIMFFLLASFMMVSLSQTHMKGIPVNLPSNVAAQPTPPTDIKDTVSIRVTEGGLYYFDNTPVGFDDVMPKLFDLQKQNPNIKVSLSAETLALHGDVIGLLDKIRLAKITKIGYQIKTANPTGAPGTVPAPGPAAPPPPPPKP